MEEIMKKIKKGQPIDFKQFINTTILVKTLILLADGTYSKRIDILISYRNLLIAIFDKNRQEINDKEFEILNNFLNQLKILINNIESNSQFDKTQTISIISRLQESFLLA